MQAASIHPVGFNLRFSVQSMAARDELILKTMVQALNRRFESQGKVRWTYAAANTAVDLQIIGDSLLPKTPRDLQIASAKSVLRVVHAPSAKHPYVLLPLRADELAIELEKLGSLATTPPELKKSNALPTLPTIPTLPPSVEKPFGDGPSPVRFSTNANAAREPAQFVPTQLTNLGELDVVRLKQWPPMALLINQNRMKLATVMNGRAMSIKTIQSRTGVAAPECQQFLAVLQAAGYLQIQVGIPLGLSTSSALSQVIAISKPPSGLLSRIRLRLGL